MGTWPATVAVGTAMPVQLHSTGCLVRVRVWLTDGVTQELITIPDGVSFTVLDLFPLATVRGSFNLWASGTDSAGGVHQTTATRVVVVQ